MPPRYISDLSSLHKNDKILVITGRSKSKAENDDSLPAKELYTGQLFRFVKSYTNYVQESIMVINHKEILRLNSLGLSQRKSAETCGCSKWTVTETISRANELQLFGINIADKTADEVSALLYPKSSKLQTHEQPDYGFVVSELSKPGVTLKGLWEEYVEQCHADGKTPYQYTQFKKYYYEFIQASKATMHLEHKRV